MSYCGLREAPLNPSDTLDEVNATSQFGNPKANQGSV